MVRRLDRLVLWVGEVKWIVSNSEPLLCFPDNPPWFPKYLTTEMDSVEVIIVEGTVNCEVWNNSKAKVIVAVMEVNRWKRRRKKRRRASEPEGWSCMLTQSILHNEVGWWRASQTLFSSGCLRQTRHGFEVGTANFCFCHFA